MWRSHDARLCSCASSSLQDEVPAEDEEAAREKKKEGLKWRMTEDLSNLKGSACGAEKAVGYRGADDNVKRSDRQAENESKSSDRSAGHVLISGQRGEAAAMTVQGQQDGRRRDFNEDKVTGIPGGLDGTALLPAQREASRSAKEVASRVCFCMNNEGVGFVPYDCHETQSRW